jgi:hypothetical protein
MEDKMKESIEYAVTTDECCIDISNNIISADSKFGRKLYDLVNSEISNFIWKDVKYTISEIRMYRSYSEMMRYRSPVGMKIAEVIRSNKVKYLVHFTRIENLSSILESGILSVQELNSRGLKYIKNDFGRYDGRRDCSCFSIEFPNDCLLNAFKKRECNSSWVVLLVDIDVLILHKTKKYFCIHNSASKGISSQIMHNQLHTPEDFQKMFSEHIEFSKSDGEYCIDRSVDKSYLTTSNQAEILIEGVVERDYIKAIITVAEDDKQIVDTIVNKYCLENRIESVLEPRYFVKRYKVKFKER